MLAVRVRGAESDHDILFEAVRVNCVCLQFAPAELETDLRA